MDPAGAPWTGEARREQTVLLGVLCFLSLENLRDAHVLFKMLKKVREGGREAREEVLCMSSTLSQCLLPAVSYLPTESYGAHVVYSGWNCNVLRSVPTG
jgi:hypothetical protein